MSLLSWTHLDTRIVTSVFFDDITKPFGFERAYGTAALTETRVELLKLLTLRNLFCIHSASRLKPPARSVCVGLSRSVCLGVCLGLSVCQSVCLSVCFGQVGHTNEHAHDVNSATSPGCIAGIANVYLRRYLLLSIFKKHQKNSHKHTIFQNAKGPPS